MKLKSIILTLAVAVATTATAQVKTGIEVLRDNGFAQLKGKKVGLITNPTGVDRNLKSTIDILNEAEGVELKALYSPEHGVRGDITAGAKVEDYVDATTGVQVYSIYGRTTKPTPEMLKGLDAIVYDIQDIGSRSYTFISTMGKAMEAAAENDLEMVILDRPNPLGGVRMEGCLVQDGYYSFVSQFPIPYVHGMTSGELAQFLNENYLEKPCKLTVVKMKGWKRNMSFEDTGLPWVLSSPHVPQALSCLFYPATGIAGELYSLNIGVGYTLPFELLAAEWIDKPELLAENLNKIGLKGVVFRPIYYKPYYGAQQGKNLRGVQIHIIDPVNAPLTLLQFYFLQEAHKLWPEHDVFAETTKSRLNMFDKVCGRGDVRTKFCERWLVEDILPIWNGDIAAFKKKINKYLLYK